MLAIIEWGTQHWHLQESFLVPVVPKWLCTIEYVQTATPVHGEMPLAPAGTHYEDIRICCPVVWSWMAVLLQFWQDHMTAHLSGGCFCQMSDLACTIIGDINVWMPHCTRFSWSYVARHAVLWFDIRDQFSEEHLEEWETQKYRTTGLNDLEHETEVVHQDRIISRQDTKERTDSKEAAAQELPLDQCTDRAERQACITPTKVDVDVSSTNARVPLYPNWVVRSKTKPTGQDAPTRYRVPKEDVARTLPLAEELDEASVLDPLQSESQSSQPDTADRSGAEGPRTPPHYSNVSSTIPPFDLTQLGILPKMSPVTEQENDLLNMAPRSPIRRAALPGLSQTCNRSECSSYSRSPMSIGSPRECRALCAPYKYALTRLPPQSSVAEGYPPLWMWMKRWTPPQPTSRKNWTRIREVQGTAHPG